MLYTYSLYITTHTGKNRVSTLSLNWTKKWTKGTKQFRWLCLLQYSIANNTLKFTKEFGEFFFLGYSSFEWEVIKMKNYNKDIYEKCIEDWSSEGLLVVKCYYILQGYQKQTPSVLVVNWIRIVAEWKQAVTWRVFLLVGGLQNSSTS